MKALLIIDMQRGSFTPPNTRFDTEGVIERINNLSGYFRQTGNKIFFIQHNGTKNNEFVPGTPEWQLLPELNMLSEDMVIDKTANDCFYESELDDLLKKFNIDELYFTGCATDFCVDSTVRSAITKRYDVTVVKDGHTTADRPGLKAQQVIAHHNWVWANMTPVKNEIKVIPFDVIMDDPMCLLARIAQ
ncbi:MAG: cysteine hydrolase [Mucilaginibacter sp.]|nr:cysteine hydrolase [Mucilaginibacter sp.]